jgi:hypothetical protein
MVERLRDYKGLTYLSCFVILSLLYSASCIIDVNQKAKYSIKKSDDVGGNSHLTSSTKKKYL